ncbi:MAG: uroporphyrinogen decarboxylase [Lentisphaerae bacterium]|nr:uroporphyrinogen decarboxylase [Lentisphaerota bacterium]
MNAAPASRFLRACAGLPVDATPIWLMRQAGRYMRNYLDVRAKYSMLDCIHTPELAAELTLQPIKAFEMDAAIIFSDILPPLMGMGLNLEFVKGEGPVLHNRLERPYDIDRLATPPAEQTMSGTLGAIKLVSAELGHHTPLIGFAGAPFTLASYAIEGGGSKTYQRTKTLMYNEPTAWQRLMHKLVTVQADYMRKQVQAGAAALQLFDSWAGHALGRLDYIHYVQPFNTQLFHMLADLDVPLINFSTGTSSYIEAVAQCGGTVLSVDWHMPIDEVWTRVGTDRPIQGNLDPIALLSNWRELKFRADDVLDRIAGRPGHIFNLGHGIFKETPVDNVKRLVDYVHERTLTPPTGGWA